MERSGEDLFVQSVCSMQWRSQRNLMPGQPEYNSLFIKITLKPMLHSLLSSWVPHAAPATPAYTCPSSYEHKYSI